MAGTEERQSLARAEKAPAALLGQQIQAFRDDRFIRQMLDAIPSEIAVLNRQRQIIYANQAMLKMLDVENESMLLGLRPGDVFDCVHVFDADEGCGTGDLCRSCGALIAITGEGRQIADCRMTRLRESRIQAQELRVTTTPFEYAGEEFTVFSIQDQSDEHRRQMLERIFFHDIKNVVGSIRGFAELLETPSCQDQEKIFAQIREAADQVIGEVEAQQVLNEAEQDELELKQEFCSSGDLLERTVRLYENHKVATLRHLRIRESAVNEYFVTDQRLILRILGNLVLNALEAIAVDQTVTLDCQKSGERLVFSIHNPGEIPEAVQPEIFRRTYSTKGPGRGLGTYSVRLLSSYLGDEANFTSSAAKGTVFSISLDTNLE